MSVHTFLKTTTLYNLAVQLFVALYMCAKYKLLPKILKLTADQTPSRRL